jgi:hypothetical protein
VSRYLDEVNARRRLGRAMAALGRPLTADMPLAAMYVAIAQALEDYADLREAHERALAQADASQGGGPQQRG